VQVSPRANIFRRDQAGVTSLDDMKHLMRYNDYDHDKLSGHHPVASVCSRGDLAKTGAVPKGCYDTKVCWECWGLESWISGKVQGESQEVWSASICCFLCLISRG
jgi:hypothetical protein